MTTNHFAGRNDDFISDWAFWTGLADLARRIRRGFRANCLLPVIAGSFLIGVANTSANVTQDLSETGDLSHWAVLSLENNGLPLSGDAAVGSDVTISGSAVTQGILTANSSTVRLSGQSETIGTIVANRIVMSDGSSVTHPPLQSP
jgi:hypothetical protein